ncbi:MAG: metal ABC transporter ATP-binding protein [Pirellulales bacterium]|nr:metal ABC transporter ATP-binding protein [Pirellulales bacterium]
MSPEGPVIDLQGVSFAYDQAPVLEDVNLSVARRESICIVGPNGGGKTTLLKLILGLLNPQSGRVEVFGQTPRRARLRVGYMPQFYRHDPQFPITVTDIVLMGRLGRPGLAGWFGWYDRADRRAARDALAEVGMDSFAGRPFSELSGGQRQRVLIARALCCQPDLLLLDEPTAYVDTLIEARLVEILKELNHRMTIVMVSHDLGFVSEMVQRVVCVNRRVLVHPAEAISSEAIREVYDGEVQMVRHDDVLSQRGSRDE